MNEALTAAKSKKAALRIAACTTEVKNAVLLDLADQLHGQRDRILAANRADLSAAEESGVSGPKLKRLALSPAGIDQMSEGLRQISRLDDPVGQCTREYDVDSGLQVRRVRCPIGVIMMIYEARPNVTVDAFALCFKAGNSCILKGGKEAARSNEALADLARGVLLAHGVPQDALTLITTSDRDAVRQLLTLSESIDLVIPRGGTELIRFVHEHSRIPTVQHFHGVCHVFVDRAADLDSALEICVTGKTSSPATCNALEAVLVDRAIAELFVPRLVDRCVAESIEIRGDQAVCRLSASAVMAHADDWGREFLDLILAVRIVEGLDEAIEHIHRYGSDHTDAVVTENEATARAFTSRVMSSCTLVNASTRFNDGFQLGLGAEIGISTSKIHAFGPMGLEELTTQRFVVWGQGQTR